MTPTKRQLDTVRFIRGYQLAKGYSPSVQEIAVGIGLSPVSKATVSELLDGLAERGHVRRLLNRVRAIEVLTDIPVPRSPEGEPLYFVGVGR
jgi:SOS-response transcriptional repressor LexA